MEEKANIPCEIFDRGGASLTQWYTLSGNEKIVFPVHLKGNIGKLLVSLSTFEVRDDDIWICGYPKSGGNIFSVL